MYSAIEKYHEPKTLSCLQISWSLGLIVVSFATLTKATLPIGAVASSAMFWAAPLPEQSTAPLSPSPPENSLPRPRRRER